MKSSIIISSLLLACILVLSWAEDTWAQPPPYFTPILMNGGIRPPCLCRGRYYKFCPGYCDRARSLRERTSETVSHPDHAEEGSTRAESHQSLDAGESLSAMKGRGMIVRHRKVYVSDKNDRFEPPVGAIDVTVKVKSESSLTDLPPVKPVFRMHKYTTVETKPQVEMVPVTTTIIKPVGVSKDQIIEDS